MVTIKCAKCGKEETIDDKCHLHHLIPKFMDGTDLDGRRYLCKKHHDILHFMMSKWLWEDFVPDSRKDVCRQETKRRTLNWIELQQQKRGKIKNVQQDKF